MTTSIAQTATLMGIDAHIVRVEADVSIGLGAFNIVGLPDGSIRESRDRITAALNNAADGFPIRRVVVNLAPADIKKFGTGFDLPIALGILEAAGKIPEGCLSEFLIIGELSLEGKIRSINGVLAVAAAASKFGIKKLIVPVGNIAEASLVEDLEIYAAEEISDCILWLSGEKKLEPEKSKRPVMGDGESDENLDFAEVKGQESAKRALEIAAAGNHNVLFFGPPGSGKSMLAKRFKSILPPPSFEEALEATKIHSIAGNLPEGQFLLSGRPFRNPHHSISNAGLIGGGGYPKPGEVSLSHRGVLFLDELPEFPRSILDLMRQPLEDKWVTISRAQTVVRFPTDFLLLAAMNPCPCGHLGDSRGDCSCSPTQIQKYRAKISGPLMDRIDLHIEMPNLTYDQINAPQNGESSDTIRSRVLAARKTQEERFQLSPTICNGAMSRKEVESFCGLDSTGTRLLSQALDKLNLSARAHDRILKVARSIADLERSETIRSAHVGEAIMYRKIDREPVY